jgi:hypothetical protein
MGEWHKQVAYIPSLDLYGTVEMRFGGRKRSQSDFVCPVPFFLWHFSFHSLAFLHSFANVHVDNAHVVDFNNMAFFFIFPHMIKKIFLISIFMRKYLHVHKFGIE